ncbi:MAG: S-layer homology domain-containing protein [Synergistaceae bacterium]|nr:S-layer homology domain-containing protein [Synergistaceae bacterium]
MRKIAALVAIAAVAALAAPAFSATNPFMDVPMNHWAYDAIGQLAAHGILSGYPDGLYKGKQQTTRYEMASALARALAVVDMTKASKQDVEMLKRLVVEFKDELEALGVRVDELDERVAVLESRLGGWHIHGTLVLDVMNESRNDAGDAFTADGKGSVKFDEARLFFERTWGENDEYFFRARLRNEGDTSGGNKNTQSAYFDRFYVEMPFFMDTRLLVGRQNWAWEGDYKISLPMTGGWDGDQILTDWTWQGMGLTKNFGLGTAQIMAAHPDQFGWEDWMIMARGTFQFTERVGFDIGGQAFIGDNAETYDHLNARGEHIVDANGADSAFNNLWTIYAGLRFNFTDAIALKGTFYHQAWDEEVVAYDAANRRHYWADASNTTDANHWSAIIDVKQDALKFTSLWLEYGQYDAGFSALNGGFLFYGGLLQEEYGAGIAIADTKYWRVGLGQQWTDQWATYLFYYGYDVDVLGGRKPTEFGAGIQYKYNDATTFGLNYMHADNDLDGAASREDNVVRFRTSVSF